MSNYNQNSGYGQGLVTFARTVCPTFGNILVVMNSANSDEANYHKIQEIFKADPMGLVRFYTSLESAYAAAESNNNDIILLDGNSTHSIDAMITVSKSRVHFVGMDGGGRLTAQGAKVEMGVTGVVTDLAPILVTGTRNSFRNIKFINASSTDESLYGFIDNGEGTFIENCSMIKTAGLDDAGWANFWMAGDSLTMKNCVLGQSNLPSAVAHYGVLIDAKTGGGSGAVKENFLENIYANMSVGTAAAATACFIKVADGAAMSFNNTIKDFNGINFVQASTGTIMTDAVLGAACTGGYLNLIRPTFMGCTGVGSDAGQGIYISQSTAPDADGGLGTELTD